MLTMFMLGLVVVMVLVLLYMLYIGIDSYKKYGTTEPILHKTYTCMGLVVVMNAIVQLMNFYK